MDEKPLRLMEKDMAQMARQAAALVWKHPRYWVPFLALPFRLRCAARRRQQFRNQGLEVPAFLIFSVTRACNLKCAGCYALAREASGQRQEPELDAFHMEKLLDEAQDLGVSFVILAGGEPLERKDEISLLARRHPGILFAVFTNGTLVDDAFVQVLARTPNLIPVVSLEGGENLTDRRRGTGVYQKAAERLQKLHRAGIFFGVSFTVMAGNQDQITSEDFVKDWVNRGSSLFFYNDYTPIQKGTEDWCLDAVQRQKMLEKLDSYRKRFPALFLAFPGDEDRYGGCLAAGRGFVHISPEGRLEACPFAPFGDTSWTASKSLKEALKSELLARIRENHAELGETQGGCALWNKRDWAEGLTARKS